MVRGLASVYFWLLGDWVREMDPTLGEASFPTTE